ncbi:hypothetical protein PIB30_109163, partial [Stylosanthes scabra]|nr:hypothetical protein [Stylosanthes scabra]
MARYNNHRFLSVFNQNIYEEAKNKDIISEKGFELKDGEYPQQELKSYVRGVEVDFSPANIKRVMKFKDQTQGAATDYSTRLATNQKLDEVLRELCIPEAIWKLGTGQNPQPIQLRRKELQPLARGWL